MLSRSYARLFALALGIPLLLALLTACRAGTTASGSATTTRPPTKILLTYHGHSDRATAVAWSPDGKYVVSGSLDKTVQVWSVSTGKTRLIYRGHTDGILAVAWSPMTRIGPTVSYFRRDTSGTSSKRARVTSASMNGYAWLWGRSASGPNWRQPAANPRRAGASWEPSNSMWCGMHAK